ncbi:response regulator [Pseudodesulfovibrio sp.]|nr:response regulator [Pseudodesulfovibrio sp.]
MGAENDYTSARVLLVDDEQNILEGHKRTLRSEFDVHVALGGEAALATLESSGPFAVVVSDLKMPKMSGIELLARIRKAYPKIVQIVLTGYADLELAINVVNSGYVFRFLTKPCSPPDLIKAIQVSVDQYTMAEVAEELAIVKRLKDGLECTLRAFTRLVEFRDPYTAGHMDRTAEIAAEIATRVGLDPERVQALHLAGLVHDIGKVAVPSGILNKKGTLSKNEFSTIQEHPTIGSEIFEALVTEWPIAQMVREHHERIDGSGYPHGLYGDEILKESKILAVADMIDALMTHRPYRRTLGVTETIKILESGKGTKLDPESVEQGIAMLKTGEVYGDPE